jgi:hypothetical protein
MSSGFTQIPDKALVVGPLSQQKGRPGVCANDIGVIASAYKVNEGTKDGNDDPY